MPLCWSCYDNHASIECETLKKLQLPTTFLLDNFDVVTPLRVLLLFYRYAEQRKMNSCVDADLKSQIDEILNMESHCVERKDSWIWKQHAKNAIQPLRKINIDDMFASVDAPWCLTDEFLQKICGILDVNTFEVRTQHFEVRQGLLLFFSFVILKGRLCLTKVLFFSYISRSFPYVVSMHKRLF